ncbi:uncharacterized protein LOC123291481 [Chrysoperla carnea]|uniref:uncharacterized protein LOC123291481 n=1 Tax=Chrysoperla carnea TaxID=189513 RepID=UPI001D098D7F|nr:uncharacterized protein LOC123291481 [Chrysoperla carnea]
MTGKIAVENFLVISGFLFAYHSLIKLENEQFSIVYLNIRRYIRLIPVIIFWACLHICFIQFFGSGPYWKQGMEEIIKPCEKYLFHTLFFIQNYLNEQNMEPYILPG